MTVAPLSSPCTEQDPAAGYGFAALYQHFAPRLTWYVTRHFGRRDVEEIVQETMSRAYQRLDLGRPQEVTWSWLTIVARNLAVDLSRSRRHCEAGLAEGTAAEPADLAPVPEAAYISAEDQRLIRKAFALLPVRQRQVIELYELDSYSCPVIARMLSTPETAVRKTLQRARRRLAQEYRALGGQLPALFGPAYGVRMVLRPLHRSRRFARGTMSPIAYAGAAAAAAAVLVVGLGAPLWLGGFGFGSSQEVRPNTRSAVLQSRSTSADAPHSSRGITTVVGGVALDMPSTPGVHVPHTPASPGEKRHFGMRVDTPVGPVGVHHDITWSPAGGVVCHSPGVTCG